MAEAVAQLRSSAGWQRWLAVRCHFHTYGFANQLLIAHSGPGRRASQAFAAGSVFGYAVRKGERGIRICPPSKKRFAEWREAGGDPENQPRTYFRLVAVFDRSQVGPLPEFPGDPLDLDPPIEPVAGDALAHLFAPLAEFGASLGYGVCIEEIPGSPRR